jgi:ATP-dependent DNA helicase RecG
LEPLFAPLASLPGVTPRQAPLLTRAVGGGYVIDMLWHVPFSIIDRRITEPLSAARFGAMATLAVKIIRHEAPERRGRPYRIRAGDHSSELDIVYFNMPAPYLQKLLPIGQMRIISGRLELYNGGLQMAHPDLVLRLEDRTQVGGVHPVYRTTAGVTAPQLEKVIHAALGLIPVLPEWIDSALKKREAWPAWHEALKTIHQPQSDEDMNPLQPARRRLAYDELLASQLTLALMREHAKRQRGLASPGTGMLKAKALLETGFTLTGSQQQAAAEIFKDMAGHRRMMRLLQGDVGSGKTIVALLAMLQAVEAGGQAALMAPTEILARQHWQTMEPICRAIGIEIALLVGKGRMQDRTMIMGGLAEGRIPLVVGTHALAQETVAFKDLRLAVIDEQHRFGVDIRMDLMSKGVAVDTLLMSATPIPRTLTLTLYGDMDVSRLTEKPPGRQPIDTRIVSLDRMDEVLEGISRQIASGARVYWVCPLVEESELTDMAAAEQRALTLQARFGKDKVGLVHGRMKTADKNAAMEGFASGALSILVATTVIEVGVNVPEATVMVIEHAERYGLAQLHQLRGRVGRGSGKSTCLLLYTPNTTLMAKERLKIIRESEDGFFIAEEDLRLRGAGEVLGTRQSGFPEFRLADLSHHYNLLEIATAEARLSLERDPDLKSEKGAALRTLLYLFERDQAVKYLRSG